MLYSTVKVFQGITIFKRGLLLIVVLSIPLWSQPVARTGDAAYNPATHGGSNLVTVIGYKAQMDAPLIDEQGRVLLELPGVTIDAFGLVAQKTSTIDWRLDNGYYPSVIYTFDIPDFTISLKYFAYPQTSQTLNGDFVLLYVRATLAYTGSQTSGLVAINLGTPAGLTLIGRVSIPTHLNLDEGTMLSVDYSISAERLSGTGDHSLSSEEIVTIAGSLDDAENAMKNFWDTELARQTQLHIPEAVENSGHLNNSFKVALIHMQIIRDDDELHIGENGYDYVYDHDAQGNMASAMEMGALTFDESVLLLKNLPAQKASHDYIDALGKLPWAVAKFAQKYQPQNTQLNELVFSHQYPGAHSMNKTLSEWVHYMVEDKLEADGLAVSAGTLDSDNRATVDNLAILLGLKAYSYLCEYLGESSEQEWADTQYTITSNNLQSTLLDLVSDKSEADKYVSVGVSILTEDLNFGVQADNWQNANAYSHFFFGRMYELFLFGGELTNLVPYIDNTLDVGITNVYGNEKFITDGEWNGNFGMYGESFCTSGYNASYAEGLLIGSGKYRTAFFTAFDYIMNHQTGPYTWFESVGCTQEYGVVIEGKAVAAKAGHGSAPHVWSAMSQARLLGLTLISEKYDGTLILGRGIPTHWLGKEPLGAENYKLSNGERFSYTLTPNGTDTYTLHFTGTIAGDIIINLPAFITTNVQLQSDCSDPDDYETNVSLVDIDADGHNEIRINTEYTGKSITFTFATPTVPVCAESSAHTIQSSETTFVSSSLELTIGESTNHARSSFVNSESSTHDMSSADILSPLHIQTKDSGLNKSWILVNQFTRDITVPTGTKYIALYTVFGEKLFEQNISDRQYTFPEDIPSAFRKGSVLVFKPY